MIYKIRPKVSGGHIDVTFFTAKAENQTFACIGMLTMDDNDWNGMFEMFKGCGNVIVQPHGDSQQLRAGGRVIEEPFGEDVKFEKFTPS
jgi:hypothetical protein